VCNFSWKGLTVIQIEEGCVFLIFIYFCHHVAWFVTTTNWLLRVDRLLAQCPVCRCSYCCVDYGSSFVLPIPVAARSKARGCGSSLAGVAGWDPAGVMGVCLLWVLCIVRGISVGLVDRSPNRVSVESDREDSVMRRSWPTRGRSVGGKKITFCRADLVLTVCNFVIVDVIGIWDLHWYASAILSEAECSVPVERTGVSELLTLYILGLISSIFEDLVRTAQ
jgi:hypothetical protein